MTYKQHLERNIRLFYLRAFFMALIFSLPIWIDYYRHFFSFSQIAFLEAMSTTMITLLELPTGALADLLGRKKTIVIGLLLWTIANLNTGIMTTAIRIVLSYALFSLGEALISGSDIALLYDSLKELGRENEFAKIAARNGLIFRLSLGLSSLLGAWFYQKYNGLPYIMMGLARLIAAIMVLKMIEPKIDSEKFTLKNYLIQTKIGFKQIFKSRYMRRLTLFYTVVGGLTWSCINYFNYAFLYEIGFNTQEQSVVFAIIYVIASLAVLYLVKIFDKNKLNRVQIYLFFPIVIFIFFSLAGFANKLLGALIIFFLLFTAMARYSLLDRMANQEFESKYRATAVSALNMLVSLFYVVIIAISGLLQDTYSTKIVMSGLGILSIFFTLPTAILLIQEYRDYQQRKKIDQLDPEQFKEEEIETALD